MSLYDRGTNAELQIQGNYNKHTSVASLLVSDVGPYSSPAPAITNKESDFSCGILAVECKAFRISGPSPRACHPR
jgi:hypothetical protein